MFIATFFEHKRVDVHSESESLSPWFSCKSDLVNNVEFLSNDSVLCRCHPNAYLNMRMRPLRITLVDRQFGHGDTNVEMTLAIACESEEAL